MRANLFLWPSAPLLHRLVQETVDCAVEQDELLKLAQMQLLPGFNSSPCVVQQFSL